MAKPKRSNIVNLQYYQFGGTHIITSPTISGLYCASTDRASAFAMVGPSIDYLKEANAKPTETSEQSDKKPTG